MSSNAKRLLGLLGGAVVLALLIMFVVVLISEIDGSSSSQNQNAFGHLTALVVLVLFTLLVLALGRTLRGFIVGKDKRVSTSKLQVLVWTYAIAGALMSLVAATWVGPDTGFDALTDDDFDFEPYLVLLGGPFLAAVLSRVIVGSQVANGEAAKPPGEPSLRQAVTNDDGDADLVDAQYLLFNIIALAYFLGAFLESPTEGFPNIPTLLYVLTGASAAAYVSNKAVAAGKPRITSIYPASGPSATPTPIEIFGLSLLHPHEEGHEAENAETDDFYDVRVLVGTVGAPVTENSITHSKSGEDRLKATVPAGLPTGMYDVKVLNFRGTPSEPAQFEVK